MSGSLRRTAALVAVSLVAFALRLHRLAEPLVRWDEGWSVAHASRAWGEIVRIASWEVHPPLFYLLLKPWLALGRNVFVVRFFPVVVGMLAPALAYRVAHRWMGSERLAWLAAAVTALAPALVYYGQVLRMYPLVVVWLLLAAWAMLEWQAQAGPAAGRRALLGLVLAGLASLYTLYYAAFALAGLYVYGLWTGRGRRKGLLAAGAAMLVLYLPWAAYAGPGLLERMGQAVPASTRMPVTPWGLAVSVWTGLTFDFGSGGWGALTVLVTLVLAAVASRPRRVEGVRLLFAVTALLVALTGAVVGSGAYFFAPRLLTPAVPFLLLLLAWGLDRLGRRSVWLLAGAAALLALTFYPTASRFVYEKSLEVSGPFDPHEIHGLLHGRARRTDYVFFNELALAGWYELDRVPQEDPGWGYALRWTPIIEPLERITPRVERALERHPRLWFVLYQGSFGPGAELKAWLDTTLFPVSMDWGRDSLLLSYVRPAVPSRLLAPQADFGQPGMIRLEAAETSERPSPEGALGVALRWRALRGALPDCRIVIQVWDETGAVLAQRDVRPANWERPTSRWNEGDVVEDRHGLLLSAHSATPLHLAVSVYEEDSGAPVPVGGAPFLELGTLEGW